MKKDFYNNLIDNLFDGLYFVDKNKKITYWNKSAEKITGFSRDEVTGHCCADNILRHVDEFGNELCIKGCPLSATLADGKTRDSNVYLHHKNGHRVPVSIRVSPVTDEKGEITGAVELFSDLSGQQQVIEEVEKLRQEVLHDYLTGVGNRKYGDLQLSYLYSHFEKEKIPFAVLFLDIDNFKSFNDTYGHNIGDRVLNMIAQSTTAGLRPFDVLIRWGGEEFLVLLPNCSLETTSSVAERIRMLIERSFIILDDGRLIKTTVSIGGTNSQENDTIDVILKRADTNLYTSKENGKNRVTV